MPVPDAGTWAARGRFAPSPTGALHFGSAVAALGSFLDARARRGGWLVRMEDIDPPREIPGASDAILRDLALLGLDRDGPVLFQSQRCDAYQAVLDKLLADGMAYWCTCSRRDILEHPANARRDPGKTPIYPGTCRGRYRHRPAGAAVRLQVDDADICFDDRMQGRQCQNLAATAGDFVILRRDGLFAYQLAVTVDDDFQRITDVVRGADLLDSTPRQILLRRRLGLVEPRFAHLPLVVTTEGEKLSKQTGARGLDLRRPGVILHQALTFLEQSPPEDLGRAPVARILEWALAHWRPEALLGAASAQAPASLPD